MRLGHSLTVGAPQYVQLFHLNSGKTYDSASYTALINSDELDVSYSES